MGRIYTCGFEDIVVAAAQDLLAVKGSTGKVCRILRMWLGAGTTTLVTAQGLSLRATFLPVTVTAGTGGAAVTPRPLDPGDPAAAFTSRRNDTTVSTSSGTKYSLMSCGWHIYAPFVFTWPRPPVIGLNQQFVFELLNSAPSGTINMSGGVEVEEIGL